MHRYIIVNIETSEPLIFTNDINVAVDKFTDVCETIGNDYVRESVERYGLYGKDKYALIDCETSENLDDVSIMRNNVTIGYYDFVEQIKRKIRCVNINKIVD